jgi:hypothetical protein
MEKAPSWLKKLLSEDYADDVKRAVFLALALVHIVSLFLLMYIKIEIANKDLVHDCLDWNGWLVVATGGLVMAGPAFAKWIPGGPKNVVSQDVDKQTIQVDQATIAKKDEPLKE